MTPEQIIEFFQKKLPRVRHRQTGKIGRVLHIASFTRRQGQLGPGSVWEVYTLGVLWEGDGEPIDIAVAEIDPYQSAGEDWS